MGLIKWLKREIETSGHFARRRQSEPPIPSNFDPNVTRNDAYIDALSKFNDWRTRQRIERESRSQISSDIIFEEAEHADTPDTDDVYSSDDLMPNKRRPNSLCTDPQILNSEGTSDLGENIYSDDPHYMNEHQPSQQPCDFDGMSSSDECSGIYMQSNNRHIMNRDGYSLPAVIPARPLFIPTNAIRSVKSKRNDYSGSNKIIYENDIAKFEQYHGNNTSAYNNKNMAPGRGDGCSPSVFYQRESSQPYPDAAPTSVDLRGHQLYATPKKTHTMKSSPRKSASPFKIEQKQQPHHRLSMDPPQKPERKSIKTKNNELPRDTSYHKYETPSDNNFLSNKKMNKSVSSGGHLRTKVQPIYRPAVRRYSPPYQTVVNKHGDIVEYALPYSEQEDEFPIDHVVNQMDSNMVNKTDEYLADLRNCEETIREKFHFLNEKYGDMRNTIDPLYTYMKMRNDKTQVTDLDVSNNTAAKLENSQQSVVASDEAINHVEADGTKMFQELDSLEKWSRNLSNSNYLLDLSKTSQSAKKKSNPVICWPNEIQHRSGVLRSTNPSPLDLSSGSFRSNDVSVRRYTVTNDKKTQLASEAIKRDFELLNRIRHADVMTLMAVCYDKTEKHISLVMEPVDYTLNYYLHQIDKSLTPHECITIIEQISSAVLYLQESGYIHSNISSHAILMKNYPKRAKLASFELATDISTTIYKEIHTAYADLIAASHTTSPSNRWEGGAVKRLLNRGRGKHIAEQYRKMSKTPQHLKMLNDQQNDSHNNHKDNCDGDDTTCTSLPAKYLPYSIDYRRKFALHYYQAPEMLISSDPFVFPTKSTDVYSITLLLWEILNNCVPFVVYSADELEKLYEMRHATLPIFERERCENFVKFFEYGLEISANKRILTIQHFVSLLDDIKSDLRPTSVIARVQDAPHKRTIISGSDTDSADQSKLFEASNNKVNSQLNSRISEKKVLSKNGGKNACDAKGSLHQKVVCKNINSSSEQNVVKKSESILEFDEFLSPKNTELNYERTSTMKLKPKQQRGDGRAIKDLFPNESRPVLNDQYARINGELDAIADNITHSKEDFLDEIQYSRIDLDNVEHFSIRELVLPTTETVTLSIIDNKKAVEFPRCESLKSIHHQETSPATVIRKIPNKAVAGSCPTSYRFSFGDYSLPDTPIARRNKIRKNAWLSNKKLDPTALSEHRKKYATPGSLTSNQSRRKGIIDTDDEVVSIPLPQSSNHNSPVQNKQLNVSIKIIHNKSISPKEDTNENKITKDHITPLPADVESGLDMSISSRVKFFNSLDSPGSVGFSPRSPMLRKKSTEVTENRSYSERDNGFFSSQTITQICELSADISKCFSTGHFESITPAIGQQISLDLVREETPKSTTSYSLLANSSGEITPIPKPPRRSIPMNLARKIDASLTESTSGEQHLPNSNNTSSILSEVFAKIRESPLSRQKDEVFETMLWKREMERCGLNKSLSKEDTSPIISRHETVKDTVQKFETSLQNVSLQKIENKLLDDKVNNVEPSPVNPRDLSARSPAVSRLEVQLSPPSPRRTISKIQKNQHYDTTSHIPVQVEHISQPEWDHVSSPMPVEAFEHETPVASSSVTQETHTVTTETIEIKTPANGIEPVIPTVASARKKKLTTRVTLNMRKVSRRASDIGIDPKRRVDMIAGENHVRHSVCGSEILKTFNQAGALLADRLTKQLSSANVCGSEVGTSEGLSRRQSSTGTEGSKIIRYVCCKCGTRMRPDEMGIALESVSNTSTEGSCGALKRSQGLTTFPDGRSTEDLYIDDDFYQGICLGANMELVANTTNFFDSYEFDIVSAEIFQSDDCNLASNELEKRDD